jgi:hypothetical protein
MGYSVEEIIRFNDLFDLYQELLTEKQRIYFRYYFSDNYSLSEISEILGVSRNAVFLQIKNVIKNIEEFEEKLRLLELNKNIEGLIIELRKNDKLEQTIKDLINKIEKVK